ncbi:MAG: ribonuclease HII [Clostridia bacterium]|nr:ribonuclease HII [Oscillospiraceae bacterium]MBR6694663.1 ribonuclease HII [Clostridia bacterium]
MPDFSYENAAKQRGYSLVCGVDEAGRGPLMGPVCAAAVILPDGLEIEGLNDSKKLSEKKREALFPVITEKALAFCVAFASVEEIEEHNILEATYIAMNRAIAGLSVPADFALIDGNRVPRDIKIPCETVVKGDAKSQSIAAASILAKVSRDRLMEDYDKQYPQYNFLKHKGYGTAEHIAAIKEFGPCPLHRQSFLKNIK